MRKRNIREVGEWWVRFSLVVVRVGKSLEC